MTIRFTVHIQDSNTPENDNLLYELLEFLYILFYLTNNNSFIIDVIYDDIDLTDDDDECLVRNDDRVVSVNSITYKNIIDKMYDDKCSICIEKYTLDDIVSVLDCKHIYHTNCIKEWGKYKPECPLCKKKINEK